MEKRYQITSLDEMNDLAKKIVPFCFPGSIIGLKGDLGSGKTTFTKFLAHHLGVKGTVNSPTFNILKIYSGEIEIYHMDVYRLENIGYDYELDDFIYGNGCSIIEWYPFIQEMLPKDILEISIEVKTDSLREVIVKGSGIYEQKWNTLSD